MPEPGNGAHTSHTTRLQNTFFLEIILIGRFYSTTMLYERMNHLVRRKTIIRTVAYAQNPPIIVARTCGDTATRKINTNWPYDTASCWSSCTKAQAKPRAFGLHQRTKYTCTREICQWWEGTQIDNHHQYILKKWIPWAERRYHCQLHRKLWTENEIEWRFQPAISIFA